MPSKIKTIIIKKPIYETADAYAVGIYDRRVYEAKERKELLAIETMGQVQIYQPEWILKNCKTIKKVYKIPNKPMTEYVVFVPKKTKDREIKEMAEAGIFG